jgi:hypothetical protein
VRIRNDGPSLIKGLCCSKAGMQTEPASRI